MTKGFKDSSGKFRPTENKNGVRKSRDQSTKTEGIRMKRNSKSNIKFLTVERLRKFNDETVFDDNDGDPHKAYEIWEMLESRQFDNDDDRNRWLKKKFGNIIEGEVVPFGKKHKHKFDHVDYEDGVERGHCEICGHWVDTSTGKMEVESF